MKLLEITDLKTMLDGGEEFLLLSVLYEDVFGLAHIPGSKNVTLHTPDFAKKVEQMTGGTHGKVVVYCGNIDCDASTQAAAKLDEAGFTNVLVYKGGLREWTEAGEELEGASRAVTL